MRESLCGIGIGPAQCAQLMLTPWPKQVVTAKGTPGHHHGVAGEHEAGLSHPR